MANNPYVNKVQFGGQTIMDISDTDAEESDVAEGKIFYKGTGQRSVGTGSGGGSSIQVEVLPAASIDELGKIYQYVGEHSTLIDYADNATTNFVGEGYSYYYSIANNNIQLIGQTVGVGMVKCTQPLTNKGVLTITKTYNGVGANVFTHKTILGTTPGGNDIYESEDWGRASGVETIDLSKFNEETIYVSFRVNVTQINSGQKSVYTISSVLYDKPDDYTKGYFYQCKSTEDDGTITYYWEAIPTQEGYKSGNGINITDHAISTDNMPAEDVSEVSKVVSPLPSIMSRRFKYSTEEQVVGTWIDGKPIYQKSWTGLYFEAPSSSWYTVSGIDLSGVEKVVFGIAGTNNGYAGYLFLGVSNGTLEVLNSRNAAQIIHNITLQYTKTTD